jgi:FAD linked oxidases, C-terminal domain
VTSTSSCPSPSPWPTTRPPSSPFRHLVLDTVVHDFGGSFSAEHGIGPKNADVYTRYVPPPIRDIAKSLKHHLDPHDILGWRPAGQGLPLAPPDPPDIIGTAAGQAEGGERLAGSGEEL